ncbi:MAG: hypothetical protein MJ244_02485 [Clostridia bacterium]|nr:hypothetical protein [Clostridia bacterium]
MEAMRILLAGIAVLVCLCGASIFVLGIISAFEKLSAKIKIKKKPREEVITS